MNKIRRRILQKHTLRFREEKVPSWGISPREAQAVWNGLTNLVSSVTGALGRLASRLDLPESNLLYRKMGES